MTTLVLFTIYAQPTDYPEAFVARRWFVFPGEEEPRAEAEPFVVGMTLDAVRGHLPPGLTRLARCEGDDPAILETWL